MHCWVYEQNNIYLDHLMLWLRTTGYFVSRQILNTIRVSKLNKNINSTVYLSMLPQTSLVLMYNKFNKFEIALIFFFLKAEIWSETNCRICTPSKTYQLLHKLPCWNSGGVLLFKSSYLRTRPLSVMFVHSKMLVLHTYFSK